MLEYSFGLKEEAAAVNRAMEAVLNSGRVTADLKPAGQAGHDVRSRRRSSGKHIMKPRTIIEKIWDNHVVAEQPGAPGAALYRSAPGARSDIAPGFRRAARSAGSKCGGPI